MKRNMLVPDYLSEFQCTGGECEDSCCSGFTVPVGKQTYDLYQTMEDKDFKRKLESSLHLSENPHSELDYSYLDARCDCPFLTEKGLCSIQSNFGEQSLSSACSKYPRQTNALELDMERSATVSCPEIARLVLKRPQGISFTELEQDIDDRDFLSRHLKYDMGPVVSYFHELRNFTIDVLQNRSKTLDDRFNILTNFYRTISRLVAEGIEIEIPNIIQTFRLGEINLHPSRMEVDVSKVLSEIAHLGEVSPFVRRYEETFSEVVSGFITDFDESVGQSFIEDHSYMIENYLVNYVFKNMFPLSYGDTIFESFQMLQLHYILIQVHLLGVASNFNYMDEDVAVRVIQSWTKEAEHSSIYLEKLFLKLMKE